METLPAFRSISNNWTDFNSLGSKLKPEEFIPIEIETNKIGFFIRSDKSTDILFYQMGNGEDYIPGKDYVYGIKGIVTQNNLPKENITVLDRKSGFEIGKISLKPFESIEDVQNVIKSLGKFGPNDILLYFTSGLVSPPSTSSSKPSGPTTSAPIIKPQVENVKNVVIKTTKNYQEKTAKREGAACVTLIWPYPASSVQVTGSFTQWKVSYPLHQEGDWLLTRLYLEPGVYQYKFLVDGIRWCYDVNKPFIKDPSANINNELVVVAHN